MSSWADQYLELRAAVLAGDVPCDVGRWALDELAALAPHYQRAIVRDRFVVAAARHLSGSGSTWARATALRSELENLDRRCTLDTPARELIAEARRIDPGMPHSIRGLYRILVGADPTDNESLSLSVPAPLKF